MIQLYGEWIEKLPGTEEQRQALGLHIFEGVELDSLVWSELKSMLVDNFPGVCDEALSFLEDV